MDLKTLRNLPVAEIARLVHQAGPKVCVFPINGTRRWFVLEHSGEMEGEEDFAESYLTIAGQRHIELYRLLFDHGLDTLLTPVFGPDLLARGEGYVQAAVEGLSRLATHPDFLEFYDAYQVRVRFYGDHRKFFASTPYAHLPDLFDAATDRTRGHARYRLFFGVFAHDATETVVELAIRHHVEQGSAPDKRTLVELYYGEYVAPVDLFIGFDKFCVFDMPLVATGNEDLYFTICPSLYLSELQLREILYDHLYARREEEPDYVEMGVEDWAAAERFYRANLDKTLGVGVKLRPGGFWYPVPQVVWPEFFEGNGLRKYMVPR